MSSRKLPIPDPVTDPFWKACQEERFVAQACEDCRSYRWPPSPVCPRCRSLQSCWQDLDGRGTIWTFTTVHHAFHPSLADELPYVVGLIDLDEGLRIVGRIEPEGREVAIGARVRVRFREVEGRKLPYFGLEG